MVKDKNLQIFLFTALILAALGGRASKAAKPSESSDIFASIDQTVVTKYDVDEFKKVFALVNINISAEDIGAGGKLDESYINVVKKANIARRNGVSLTDGEKSRLWLSVSMKSGNSMSIDSFCEKNKIGRKFLDGFLENLVIWQKHLNENIKRLVAGEVSEELIQDYIEYSGSSAGKVVYDLSRISLSYMDSDQRSKAMLTLNRAYSKLENKNSSFKLENLEHVKPEKIVAIPEADLHAIAANSLKNVAVGGVTKPFCIGNEKGTCFIFMVEKREIVYDEDTYKKMNVVETVFSRVLENRVEKELENYSNGVKITYYR
jgi:ACT domain-containing protein